MHGLNDFLYPPAKSFHVTKIIEILHEQGITLIDHTHFYSAYSLGVGKAARAGDFYAIMIKRNHYGGTLYCIITVANSIDYGLPDSFIRVVFFLFSRLFNIIKTCRIEECEVFEQERNFFYHGSFKKMMVNHFRGATIAFIDTYL